MHYRRPAIFFSTSLRSLVTQNWTNRYAEIRYYHDQRRHKSLQQAVTDRSNKLQLVPVVLYSSTANNNDNNDRRSEEERNKASSKGRIQTAGRNFSKWSLEYPSKLFII